MGVSSFPDGNNRCMRNSPARLSLIQGNSLVALGSAVTCCCINQIETNIYISETIIAEIFSR
jgi:hypothetical protein